MVHELHKAGYQRIRICPALAPSGVHWRCTISYAGNLAADGLSFRAAADGHVASYTSGQGARYFDWPDGDRLTARELARRFITAFPPIAEHGIGRDWPYAGWLTDVLGYAEHGRFVAFWADYPWTRTICTAGPLRPPRRNREVHWAFKRKAPYLPPILNSEEPPCCIFALLPSRRRPWR